MFLMQINEAFCCMLYNMQKTTTTPIQLHTPQFYNHCVIVLQLSLLFSFFFLHYYCYYFFAFYLIHKMNYKYTYNMSSQRREGSLRK